MPLQSLLPCYLHNFVFNSSLECMLLFSTYFWLYFLFFLICFGYAFKSHLVRNSIGLLFRIALTLQTVTWGRMCIFVIESVLLRDMSQVKVTETAYVVCSNFVYLVCFFISGIISISYLCCCVSGVHFSLFVCLFCCNWLLPKGSSYWLIVCVCLVTFLNFLVYYPSWFSSE